jgi:glycosyltransferase involved in cell wall biosynthesis
MKQIHYITYNDTYSGIYQSQVIDVVEFLNKEFDVSVSLTAFVPLRMWLSQKQLIKSKLPTAKVFPILGSLKEVKRTSLFLKFIKNKHAAICRGPLAFQFAKDNYTKVIYDGRAAVEAEVIEYQVTGSKDLDQLLIKAEQLAIKKADYFISVSNRLITYWEEKLGHKIPLEKYSIIPCTLTSQKKETEKGNTSKNVKVLYSGGTGGWQSFEKVVYLLDELMGKQENLKALFLTKENRFLTQLIEKYPDRCSRKWVNHDEVFNELSCCDYGILLREDKVTNRVASPVKFAEYLNAGLKVLISPNIGDFSEFVKAHNCGIIVKDKLPALEKLNEFEIEKSKALCEQYFIKSAPLIKENYRKLINAIN